MRKRRWAATFRNVALEGYALLKVSGKGDGIEALRKLLSRRFNRAPRAVPPIPAAQAAA
ncbi:MAG: hypothetical protein M3Q96_06050 [Pseudomonadota bacterium]|nr:hypothetical protein [Pseudomonadota bacterium]